MKSRLHAKQNGFIPPFLHVRQAQDDNKFVHVTLSRLRVYFLGLGKPGRLARPPQLSTDGPKFLVYVLSRSSFENMYIKEERGCFSLIILSRGHLDGWCSVESRLLMLSNKWVSTSTYFLLCFLLTFACQGHVTRMYVHQIVINRDR